MAMQGQRSVPEVLQDIVGNLQEIIRSEFRLAKTEFKKEAAKASRPVKTIGAGLVAGFYGIGFLLLGAVYGLSRVMADWLAALTVGGVLAVIGVGVFSAGRKALQHVNFPSKTTESLEENVQWAKQQIK